MFSTITLNKLGRTCRRYASDNGNGMRKTRKNCTVFWYAVFPEDACTSLLHWNSVARVTRFMSCLGALTAFGVRKSRSGRAATRRPQYVAL